MRNTVKGELVMDKQIYLSKLTRRFRVTLEESWQGESKNSERRWLEIIECLGFKKGPGQEGPFISLYSEDPPTLQLYTNRVQNAKRIWGAIKKHLGTRADFHMDGEAVLFFPPSCLGIVATLASGRKRRILTEEQRAALIERGKVGREALKKFHMQRVQAQNSTQGATIPTQVRG
jgi:hypothetical protein